MVTGQAQTKGLICLEQMAEVGPGVVLTGIAVTVVVQGSKIFFILGILDHQPAFRGHAGTVTGNPGRQNTVKHINASDNPINQTIRRSYSHQVTGFIFW